jgi:hypothetical protein
VEGEEKERLLTGKGYETLEEYVKPDIVSHHLEYYCLVMKKTERISYSGGASVISGDGNWLRELRINRDELTCLRDFIGRGRETDLRWELLNMMQKRNYSMVML